MIDMRHGTLAAGITVGVLVLTRVRYLVTTDNSPLAGLDRKTINILLFLSCIRFLLVLIKPAANRKWQRVSAFIQAGLLIGFWISKLNHHLTYALTAYKSVSMKTCMEATSHYFVEGFLSILQQGPLYRLNIVPAWVVTLLAVFDIAVTSAMAVNQIQTIFMLHFLKEFVPVVVTPYVVHTLLPRLEARSTLSHTGPAAAHSGEENQMKEPFGNIDGVGAKQSSSQPNTTDNHLSTVQKLDGEQSAQTKGDKHCDQEFSKNTLTAPGSTKHPSVRMRNNHMPYRSKLTRPSRQVSIKLRSGLRTTDIPPDLAVQLQTSLNDICGCSYAVSNLAVREGCIVVRFELLPTSTQSAAIQAASHVSEADNDSGVTPQTLAQAMLRAAQPLLRGGDEAVGVPLTNGEHARVQLDDTVLRCYWNADHQEWRFETSCDGVRQDEEEKKLPQLGMIRLAISNTGNSALQGIDGSETAYTDAAAAPYSAECLPRQCPCKKVLLLDADVVGFPNDWSEKVLLSRVKGWTAPNGKHNRQDVDWDSDTDMVTCHSNCDDAETVYQILAHSNGIYLNTRVCCVRQMDAHAKCSVLVDISDSVCHHSDQPLPCLQALTLELWSKELLISSQSAVLPAMCDESCPPDALHLPCWWWGSNAPTVTAAVAELQQFTAGQQQAGETWQHGDLLHDICMWLTGVRDVAQTHGHCVVPTANRTTITPHIKPPVDRQQLMEVGRDLLNYTRNANLLLLKAMLQQQLAFVEGCHSTSTATRNPGLASRMVAALQVLRTSAVGYGCGYCEQLYRHRLSRQLAGIQALCACLLVANTSVLLVKAVNQRDTVYLWVIGTWYVPLSWICIRYIMNKGNARSTCSSGSAWCLCISATWWAVMGSGTVATPPGVLRLSPSVASASINLLLSMAEQLQASTTLPAAFITAIAMCIAFCQAVLGFGVGPHVIAGILNLLFNVGARLLADIQLRSMLMKLPCTTQAC